MNDTNHLPDQQQIRARVEPLAERLELARELEPYEAFRWDGRPVGTPIVHIDDFAAIPFLVDITGVEEYQHRARLRATADDLYLASTDPTPGYEAYCTSSLGLDPVEFQRVDAPGRPMYLAAGSLKGRVWRRLLELATSAGGLTLHPFMGSEDVWTLARAIGSDASVPVTVLAPPPPVTWIANDKALFDEVVEQTLGRQWLVETKASADLSAMARQLAEMASRHRRVALKRLRCASAMGNQVFDSGDLTAMGPERVRRAVGEFLQRTEWQGDEEVLVVAWENAEHSPSTQLWIPAAGRGEPRLDGVYEQILAGDHKVFVGSRPSQLPAAVNRQLATASLAIARALQALGYVGRCSFDFLVVGDPEADFEVFFTECNGRWGGTSTPMALLDRVFPEGRPPYRARDFVHTDLVGASFQELLEAVGDRAWHHQTGLGSFLFYNTGPLPRFGKLDVIALGTDQASADAALEEELPRLWGL